MIPNAATRPATDSTDNKPAGAGQPLEVLKALHAANFKRWEKRRNYEWLLSYGIWGALAGFIGVVVFGKDSAFDTPASHWIPICLGLLCIVHALYLFFIIDATLRDLDAQRIVERAMADLIKPGGTFDTAEFTRQMSDTAKFRGLKGARELKWYFARHGLLGQVALTVLLCVAAWWASAEKTRPRLIPAPAIGAGGTYCQGCTQYFTPQPPAAAVSPQPADRKSPTARRTRKH